MCYASHTLTVTKRKYLTTERECLVIITFVVKFRPYLYGQEFTIVTDHKALQWLQTHHESMPKLSCWMLRLEEYDYQILHRPGVQHANAMMRAPVVDE